MRLFNPAFYYLAANNQCPASDCAPQPGSIASMDAYIQFPDTPSGQRETVSVNGAWGCADLKSPNVLSAMSTGSTQLTFHFGKGCVGHVVKQVMGGFTDAPICAGSVFIKFNRYGSC